MPQNTRRRPTQTGSFWENFQRWLNTLQAQGGLTRGNFPAPTPASVSYPGYGYTGYRSQGGQAWGAPLANVGAGGWTPQPATTPASNVLQSPAATTTGTQSPYGTSWGQFYNPTQALLTRGGPVTTPAPTTAGTQNTTGYGQGTPGYFAGVPNEYAPGGYYGGGWGNQNLVWGGEGYYRPSNYGSRAYGLSELNVNNQTGELQGSLNRYGQALGTPAPLMAHGPQRPWSGMGKVYAPEGQEPVVPTNVHGNKFDARAAKGSNQRKKGGGGGTGSSGYNPGYWQNELISWRF